MSMRGLLLLVLLATGSNALGQEIPPFTMKFEEALQAYGKCVKEVVDRYDLAVTSVRDAAGGAVGACEASYQAAEAQLADDFITRQGYSQKSAKASAARNMRTLRPMMTKTALDYAKTKQPGKNAAN